MDTTKTKHIMFVKLFEEILLSIEITLTCWLVYLLELASSVKLSQIKQHSYEDTLAKT